MRKDNTARKSTVVSKKTKQKLTVGVDLGDRSSRYCISPASTERGVFFSAVIRWAEIPR